jgi:hypothetical protein
MEQPRYEIGKTIRFQNSSRGVSASPGEYKIIGYRPSDDEPIYRIKSDLERHERIARQSELTEAR